MSWENADGTLTNVKGLPEGRTYFTELGYSQTYPWVEVHRTPRTVVVAKVSVEQDPEWLERRQFVPGGFHGHTPNQHEQTWLYGGVNEDYRRRLHWSEKRGAWVLHGVRYVEGRAVEHYDYNF